MSGEPVCLSSADVAGCARAYDPHRYPAPLVLGHPVSNGPAQGSVVSLHASDGDLFAEVNPDPALRDLVQAGRFKKLSASFWPPSHPENPAPGVWSLRHVGFLGAAVPAVLGLAPVDLGGCASSLIEFGGCDAIETAARRMAGLPVAPVSFASPEDRAIEEAARRMVGLEV